MMPAPPTKTRPQPSSRLTGPEIQRVLIGLGMPQAAGINLPAWYAATAMSESYPPGNPSSLGDIHDGVPDSFGLWQVNAPAHPELADRIRSIMSQGLTPKRSAIEQAKAIGVLFRDATKTGIEAARILESRGFRVTSATAAGLVDAIWQRGPEPVLSWARSTSSPAVAGINPRAARYFAELSKLAGAPVSLGPLLIAAALLGLLLWFLSE